VKKEEYTDADFNMRRRFFEETTRFLKKTQKKDDQDPRDMNQGNCSHPMKGDPKESYPD